MTGSQTAADLTSKALAILAAGQPELALGKIEEALAADPESRFAHFVRGNILKRLDRCEEAMLAYDRAALVESAWWHAERATCLSFLGRHKQAFVAADEAVRLDPSDPVAWYRKGATLLRAAQRNPLSPDRKLEKKAEAALKQAIELDPQAYMPRIDLARLYFSKDRKAAARLTNEALALKFGDPRIHFIAAELALISGRLEEAASHAEIVVSAEPASPQAVRLVQRVRHAQKSGAYRLYLKLGTLTGPGRLLFVSVGAGLGLAAAAGGVTRAQMYGAVVVLGTIAAVWVALAERKAKRALAAPALSPDY